MLNYLIILLSFYLGISAIPGLGVIRSLVAWVGKDVAGSFSWELFRRIADSFGEAPSINKTKEGPQKTRSFQ